MPSTRGLAAAAAAVCGAGLLMLTAPVAHATASESPPESSVTIDAPDLCAGDPQPIESTDPGETGAPEPSTDPVETPDPVDPVTPSVPGGIGTGSSPILAVPEQAAPAQQSEDSTWSEDTDSSSSSDTADTSGSASLAKTGSEDTLTGVGLAGLLAVAAGITTKLVRSARREA